MEKDFRFREIINFRDLGGYVTSEGKKVKRGLIYRSGSPSRMIDTELAAVRSLKLKTILDLRTDRERVREPEPAFPGVNIICHSGLIANGAEIDFSPRGMSQTGEEGKKQLSLLHHYYRHMPYENDAFRLLFEELLENNVPLLFHCATGKDRTGVAAILILLALGLDDDIVLWDYMLSNEYRKHQLRAKLKGNAEKIENDPVLKELLTMREAVSETIGQQILHSIRNRFGTYEEFFELEYGLDKEKIDRLKDLYLE